MFAQTPELISPWATLILQGGAFALLAYIVIVVYPNSVKQAREEREQREKASIAERTERDTRYTGALNHMTVGIKESTETTSQTFKECAARIESAVTSACKAHVYGVRGDKHPG